MNIFQFLGLPSNHRADKKVFQLVKHFDEVNPKADEGIYHKNVTFPMYGQVKKDGVFCALVVKHDGSVAIFNRTGKMMTNTYRLEKYYGYKAQTGMLDAGVYLGELCNDKCSLEKLSGIVNPNRVHPLDKEQLKLMYFNEIHFFDELTVEEFINGYSGRTFITRFNSLKVEMEDEKVLPILTIEDEKALRDFANTCISSGEEGAVFKQNVEYLAGAKDWHQMKVVRGISYDLICTGYEEGKGKYKGHVANLLFKLDDKRTVKAMLGKGWTMQDAREMFLDILHTQVGTQETLELNDVKSPVGQMFEVYGLQPSSKNGLIRLPKVGELRHDKTEPDII